ncbi:MAG TPA: DUF805 domain-containing protein [Rubrobacteraceae bacterium]|nr:DUF805 domain-containing protein [Rubrobacteraceae bacterium]
MSWYIEALKKYAVFGGRSRRREYWYFVLFTAIINGVLSIHDAQMVQPRSAKHKYTQHEVASSVRE